MLRPGGFLDPNYGNIPVIAPARIDNSDVTFNNLLPPIPAGVSITRPLHTPSLRISSDRRLKDNVKSLKLDKSILDIDVKEYTLKSSGEKTFGVIAQELRELFPELVKGTEGENSFLSIEETKLIYPLILELKKMRKELDEIKKRLGE